MKDISAIEPIDTAAGATDPAAGAPEKPVFNQSVYQNDYIRRKYDRVNLTMPKGQKEIVRQRAKSKGQSVNEYINALIAADLAAGQKETDGN